MPILFDGEKIVENRFSGDVEIPEPPKIKILGGMEVSSREPVPIEIKKKVLDRAKRICEYPKCKEKEFLEFHHKNLKNSDNRASNIELLCPKHHRKRHSEKIKKTVGYDILSGEKITRLKTKPRKKASARKTGKKSTSKRKTLRKKGSKHIRNMTIGDLYHY
ncbi:MAG: HNH endonuclease [Candidatus Thermoplasmatota archaeon]|nr:HNH endonuclease [Candidatus Thermoplasmatota archaeon]